MTNNQAIELLDMFRICVAPTLREAISVAINALNASSVDGDTISRQAAIEAVVKRDANCGIDSAEALKLLPSAQPQRKKGMWLYDEERCATGIYAICSACNESIYQTGNFRYCPNCGARMEETNEAD